jgi:hypothetical protein
VAPKVVVTLAVLNGSELRVRSRGHYTKALSDAGLVPAHLASCVMSNDQIAKGYRYLQLTPEVDALWNDAWSKFRAGA